MSVIWSKYLNFFWNFPKLLSKYIYPEKLNFVLKHIILKITFSLKLNNQNMWRLIYFYCLICKILHCMYVLPQGWYSQSNCNACPCKRCGHWASGFSLLPVSIQLPILSETTIQRTISVLYLIDISSRV